MVHLSRGLTGCASSYSWKAAVMDVTGNQIRAKRFSARWWVTDRGGQVVLAQSPNPALAVWLVSLVVRRAGLLGDQREDTLRLIGSGALVVWALDELLRGSSPFRRLLGVVVLCFQLVRLLR